MKKILITVGVLFLSVGTVFASSLLDRAGSVYKMMEATTYNQSNWLITHDVDNDKVYIYFSEGAITRIDTTGELRTEGGAPLHICGEALSCKTVSSGYVAGNSIVIYANHDILVHGTSTVFFYKKFLNVYKMALAQVSPIREIVHLVPIVIGLVIFGVGLRKGWQFLVTELRGA